MPKRETESVSRVHLWIYDRDKERLQQYFGHNIGISKAAREMIHRCLNTIEAAGLAKAGAKHMELSDDLLIAADGSITKQPS